MNTVETEFPMMLDRDGAEVEIIVTANGTVTPADREVGIMSEGIEDIYVDVVTAGGDPITLTPAELERVEKEAEGKLLEYIADEGNDAPAEWD